MARVKAIGKRNGIEMDVEVFMEDGSLLISIDGDYDETFQEEFNELLKNVQPIGGTYYPQPNTLLAAYSVLQLSFFDNIVDVEVIGDIGKIPTYESEDIVY